MEVVVVLSKDLKSKESVTATKIRSSLVRGSSVVLFSSKENATNICELVAKGGNIKYIIKSKSQESLQLENGGKLTMVKPVEKKMKEVSGNYYIYYGYDTIDLALFYRIIIPAFEMNNISISMILITEDEKNVGCWYYKKEDGLLAVRKITDFMPGKGLDTL